MGFPRSLSTFSLGAWTPKYGGMLANLLYDPSNSSNTVKLYAIGSELMLFRETFRNVRNGNAIRFLPTLFTPISSINSFSCNSNVCKFAGNRFNGQYFSWLPANEICSMLSVSASSTDFKWFHDKSKIARWFNCSNEFCSMFTKSFREMFKYWLWEVEKNYKIKKINGQYTDDRDDAVESVQVKILAAMNMAKLSSWLSPSFYFPINSNASIVNIPFGCCHWWRTVHWTLRSLFQYWAKHRESVVAQRWI